MSSPSARARRIARIVFGLIPVCSRDSARLPAAGAASLAVVFVLLSPCASSAQEGGVTATLRGTVNDASGAALPGAQVTLTNTGTKALQTLVADDHGAFVIPGLWPGTYELTIRLSGFKTSEQRGIVLSPNDTRGIDVTLEIGSQQETVVVTAGRDVIQTETGAREGVITAGQIENLSVIGRGALELLRILPGVVAQDQSLLEVSAIQDGPNNPQGYTVNGIRATRNAVSLDGSDLVDQTCNCGLMVSLNDDMVQEVKVQTSNFAAEYRIGRRQRERRDEERGLALPWGRLLVRTRPPVVLQRPIERHHRCREAEERLLLPGW